MGAFTRYLAATVVIASSTLAFAPARAQNTFAAQRLATFANHAPLAPNQPLDSASADSNDAALALSTTPNGAIGLTLAATYATGVVTTSAPAAEIVAYDAASQRMFVSNAFSQSIDIVSIVTPSAPSLIASIPVSTVGTPSSVAVFSGTVAAAFEGAPVTAPGRVVFMDISGTVQTSVTVGALPDALAFSPDGKLLLVANEGEPAGATDPEGSLSAIDLSGGVGSLSQSNVTPLGFTHIATQTLDPRIRVISPTATLAQQLEPESLAFSPDGALAFVTLQNNNALAVVNINTLTITQLSALGFKNHAALGNGLDPSDNDGGINIASHGVLGMYMPDAIAAYQANNALYLVTANEGDVASDAKRVNTLSLDPGAFPDPTSIKANANLGRLYVATAKNAFGGSFSPDVDNDGDIDTLYSYGGRSFSIWDAAGGLVFDSGDHIERVISSTAPSQFNADFVSGRDARSPWHGPEPEAIVVGKVSGRDYAFVSLERQGGVMVYDISAPASPAFVQYVNNRVYTTTLSAAAKDLGPESLVFVPASGPNGKAMLLVANEVSGSVSVYTIGAGSDVTLLHTNDVHGRLVEYNVNGSTACAGTTCIGGVARMATVIKQVRATVSNTLLLDAGDQFQGTLYYNVFKADGVTLTMNALGYEAMAVGNHEFDNGADELRRLIDGANFPVLSANIDATTNATLTGRIKASTVLTTAGGERIGIVGLTTEDTAFLSSGGPTIKFTPHVTATQASVNDLRAQGIDRIVLLTHLGYDIDLKLASVVTGVDVILGGHSHTFLYSPPTAVPNGDNPSGPYPTPVIAPDGNTVLVAQAFQWGRYLGRLNVRFTPDGRVSSWSGNPIYLDSGIPNDPTVLSVVSPTLTAPVAALGLQAIGKVTAPMNILSGTTQICRQEECTLGNLVADAMLWRANQLVSGTQQLPFDFAVQNGGGLRAPLVPLTVTVGNILTVLPFGNSLATFELTGTHVISSLESGLANLGVSGNGRFPQVAGMRYYFDGTRPVGQRLLAVYVRGANGVFTPIDPNRVYRIVTNDFMRKGGDGYVLFRDAALRPYDFGPILDEALRDYFASLPDNTVNPALDGRIVAGPPPAQFRISLPIIDR
jgi:2',3'-cyclic-nucleotide 2'-phosphodiesterase (5'-nucleotidase family)